MYRILLFLVVIAFLCGLILVMATGNQNPPFPKPPELRAQKGELSLTLHAVADANGRDAFGFNGHNVAPVLRVSPGDTLRIAYTSMTCL